MAILGRKFHGNKHIITMFALIMFLYFISDCYLFNSSLLLFHLPSCTSDHITQSNYYRKRWQDRNFTFYVYNIRIGKLYMDSKKLSQFEIHNLSQQIASDILHWNHSTTEKKGALRRDLFLSYFDEINHPALTSNILCTSNTDKSKSYNPSKDLDQNDFDFFEFLHFGHDHLLSNQSKFQMESNDETNELNQSNHSNSSNYTIVHWYDLLPIEDLFNGTYFTAQTAHSSLSAEYLQNSIDNDVPFYLPSLYTYTISVDISGFLPTLELRIGEIVHPMQQHNMMKHLNLNNNIKHLLWAGELYTIYDHKYKRYVLIMDNASGHWKPNAHKFPNYLRDILMETLFPGLDVGEHSSDPIYIGEDADATHIHRFVDYYRPFVTVGFYDEPFHKLKKVQFPILKEIKVWEKEHRLAKKKKKREREHQEQREIVDQLNDADVGDTQTISDLWNSANLTKEMIGRIVPKVMNVINETMRGIDHGIDRVVDGPSDG